MKAYQRISALTASFLLALLLSFQSNADPRIYRAEMHEANWMIEASVFECTLSQTIPMFGEANFYHRAGEPLRFQILASSDLMENSSVVVSSIPPAWNFQRAEKNLGQVQLYEDPMAITLDAPFAKKLMNEMLTGMVPTFSGVANFDDQLSLHVEVSPVRFSSVYAEYQQCTGDLLPVNFDQVQRSTIFWSSNQRALDEEDRKLLDNIVLYSNADPSIVGFEVDSFTDSAGERRDNLLISEERAFAVTNYLVGKGINSESIATRAHGEREEYLIVNPEQSAADRDRNRRVNVVMLRR